MAEECEWANVGLSHGSRHRGERFASGRHGHVHEGHRHDASLGSAFGVRRPLRFLAYKLDLSEAQVAEMARVLNELKTERAQAEVDDRRTVSAFADSLETESFDEGRASDSAALRVQSADKLKHAVVKALRQIHALLSPEQRGRLAYMIRTGALTL